MEDDGKVHYAEWDTEKEWYKYFSYTWITYLIPKEWKKRVDVFKKISS
ncbi:hypothetical protein Q2U85_29190 (plasmid) [Bacillus cereus]|nr:MULTISPECIES: hypothetical protein [Bacillus cereus group]MCR6789938.1 hypothetical protein [Bacillus thuringiensis]MCR6825918.1 hypothetical protein [Bacillus thuringiensis]MCR6831770.1 hypothetical protein [Bacillus thuringiensis]MEB9327348.1 hypothetical protein [Bacillus cereus]MEB9914544.1 hypothetical protein [Bacillus cereus]